MELKYSLFICFLIIGCLIVSGCTTTQNDNTIIPTTTPNPQINPSFTPSITARTTVIPTTLQDVSNKLLLFDTKDAVLWNGYKTYDIAEVNTANVDLTYQKPGETYYVSLKSDVPLLVYVINFNEANKLLDTDSIPKYDKFNNKIIYQKFAPVLKMERVYDNTGSFTVKDLGKYVVVVDARLTESDTTKTNNEMHKYELIVEKAQ